MGKVEGTNSPPLKSLRTLLLFKMDYPTKKAVQAYQAIQRMFNSLKDDDVRAGKLQHVVNEYTKLNKTEGQVLVKGAAKYADNKDLKEIVVFVKSFPNLAKARASAVQQQQAATMTVASAQTPSPTSERSSAHAQQTLSSEHVKAYNAILARFKDVNARLAKQQSASVASINSFLEEFSALKVDIDSIPPLHASIKQTQEQLAGTVNKLKATHSNLVKKQSDVVAAVEADDAIKQRLNQIRQRMDNVKSLPVASRTTIDEFREWIQSVRQMQKCIEEEKAFIESIMPEWNNKTVDGHYTARAFLEMIPKIEKMVTVEPGDDRHPMRELRFEAFNYIDPEALFMSSSRSDLRSDTRIEAAKKRNDKSIRAARLCEVFDKELLDMTTSDCTPLISKIEAMNKDFPKWKDAAIGDVRVPDADATASASDLEEMKQVLAKKGYTKFEKMFIYKATTRSAYIVTRDRVVKGIKVKAQLRQVSDELTVCTVEKNDTVGHSTGLDVVYYHMINHVEGPEEDTVGVWLCRQRNASPVLPANA